jgi:predicted ATPase
MAQQRRGGFKQVISRGQTGDISFVIKFRPSKDEPLITYELSIGLNEKSLPIVNTEILRYRRGSGDVPWKVLEFHKEKALRQRESLMNMPMLKKLTVPKEHLIPLISLL